MAVLSLCVCAGSVVILKSVHHSLTPSIHLLDVRMPGWRPAQGCCTRWMAGACCQGARLEQSPGCRTCGRFHGSSLQELFTFHQSWQLSVTCCESAGCHQSPHQFAGWTNQRTFKFLAHFKHNRFLRHPLINLPINHICDRMWNHTHIV